MGRLHVSYFYDLQLRYDVYMNIEETNLYVFKLTTK